MTYGYIYSEKRRKYTIVKVYPKKIIEVEKKKGTEYEAKERCKELNSVIEKRIWNQTSFMGIL